MILLSLRSAWLASSFRRMLETEEFDIA